MQLRDLVEHIPLGDDAQVPEEFGAVRPPQLLELHVVVEETAAREPTFIRRIADLPELGEDLRRQCGHRKALDSCRREDTETIKQCSAEPARAPSSVHALTCCCTRLFRSGHKHIRLTFKRWH